MWYGFKLSIGINERKEVIDFWIYLEGKFLNFGYEEMFKEEKFSRYVFYYI